MARFVHLAPDALRRRIDRAGLRGRTWTVPIEGGSTRELEAVFAMPILEDFAATYQWTRELRRRKRGRSIGVGFIVGDDEEVLVGRFGKEKRICTAAQAVASLREAPWGQEVIVRGPIGRRAITWVRDIRQDVGWVERPEPHSKYDCVCIACLRKGGPNVQRRCRAAYHRALERVHAGPRDAASILDALLPLDAVLERSARRLSPRRLFSLQTHADPRVRARLTWLLGYFPRDAVLKALQILLVDEDESVAIGAVEALVRVTSPRDALALVRTAAPALAPELAEVLRYSSSSAAPDVVRELAAHDPRIQPPDDDLR